MRHKSRDILRVSSHWQICEYPSNAWVAIILFCHNPPANCSPWVLLGLDRPQVVVGHGWRQGSYVQEEWGHTERQVMGVPATCPIA